MDHEFESVNQQGLYHRLNQVWTRIWVLGFCFQIIPICVNPRRTSMNLNGWQDVICKPDNSSHPAGLRYESSVIYSPSGLAPNFETNG